MDIERRRKDAASTLWKSTLPDVDRSMLSLNVPHLSAFRHLDLPYYKQLLDSKDLIIVVVYTIDHLHNKIGWIARIHEVAGLYVYVKWLGVENDPSVSGRWMNISDKSLILATNIPNENFKLIAPQAVLTSCSYNLKPASITPNQIRDNREDDYKVISNYDSGMREGMFCEILDCSSLAAGCQVRVGMIKSIVGRRLCVAVTETKSYETEYYVWLDKFNNYLFYVGWATLNGYAISAKDSYLDHCRSVAMALKSGAVPPYLPHDLRRETLIDIATHEAKFRQFEFFTRRMKLEVQDPFSQCNNELHVATVHKVFEDGYLLISLDGPDAEHDIFPVHSLSTLLFPVGYAQRNSIKLQTPPDVRSFDWDRYLRATNSVAAPLCLFKPDPSPDRLRDFPIGGKIEAFDVIEKNAICPATIKRHCGRLLLISFDGWSEDYDQLVDIDSPDIFPIGWCETNGVPLDVWMEEDVPLVQQNISLNADTTRMFGYLQMEVDNVVVKEETQVI
ncbi:unnamed protein product [Auanema sp. JU1783]|nr:unnamed protein product [Auanema sp. JU1783]